MAKKDILGTNKVRTKPEYTARTHWAGSVNFAAIFTTPVFYLLLPVLVLYVTGCFKMIANLINNLAGSAVLNQYGVMGIVALLLWQIVVCWIVWRKQIKAYESAPKYEYHFYNDIIEYKKYNAPTPKIIKVLKALINVVPAIIGVAVLGVVIFLIIQNVNVAPPSSGTPGTGTTPGEGSDTGSTVTIDWAAVWATVSGALVAVFTGVWNFVSAEENRLFVIVTGAILLIIILVAVICYLIKHQPKAPAPQTAIKMKTLPARTLPAVISAAKKLPAPAYMIPDNCPLWLKKIIFWAPVRYNYGDVIISSPKGTSDDIVLNKIEKPEELINYLCPIKPEPTEVVGYSAN